MTTRPHEEEPQQIRNKEQKNRGKRGKNEMEKVMD
jgi:hypothetical protein